MGLYFFCICFKMRIKLVSAVVLTTRVGLRLVGSTREVKTLTSPLGGLSVSPKTSGTSARLSTFPSAFPLIMPPVVRDAPWRGIPMPTSFPEVMTDVFHIERIIPSSPCLNTFPEIYFLPSMSGLYNPDHQTHLIFPNSNFSITSLQVSTISCLPSKLGW